MSTPIPADNNTGYEVATNLIENEGSLIWAQFNSLLLIHTILISAITLSDDSIIKLLFSLTGLLICGAWIYLINRGFKYYDYYFAAARIIEGRLHKLKIKTINSGKQMGDKNGVKVDKEVFKFDCGSMFKSRNIARFIAGIFILVYLLLILVLALKYYKVGMYAPKIHINIHNIMIENIKTVN